MGGFDLDPELSLSLCTGGGRDLRFAESTSSSDHAICARDEICTGKTIEKNSITIFYDGRMCTTNVTEIQARAILSMAKWEMEKGRSKENNTTDANRQKFLIDTNKNIGCFQDKQNFPNSSQQMLNQGLSMKHSLQRFLQKRKTRRASTTPYFRSN